MSNNNTTIDKQQLDSELGIRLVEYNDIAHEQDSYHYNIYYNSSTKMFIKVYNKNAVWRISGFLGSYFKDAPFKTLEDRYSCEQLFVEQFEPKATPVPSQYDSLNWTIDLFRSEKYDILPEVVFDTATYIGFEWYAKGWHGVTGSELIHDINILEARVPSKLLRSIMGEIIKIQSENLLDKNDVGLKDFLYNDYKKAFNSNSMSKGEFERRYNPCIGPTGFENTEFMLNDITGECKLVDVGSIRILPYLNNTMWIEDGNMYLDDEGYCLPPTTAIDLDTSTARIMSGGKCIRIRL